MYIYDIVLVGIKLGGGRFFCQRRRLLSGRSREEGALVLVRILLFLPRAQARAALPGHRTQASPANPALDLLL